MPPRSCGRSRACALSRGAVRRLRRALGLPAKRQRRGRPGPPAAHAGSPDGRPRAARRQPLRLARDARPRSGRCTARSTTPPARRWPCTSGPTEDLHGYATLLQQLGTTLRPAAGPVRRSPQRLRAQRSALDPRRAAARHAGPHALRPHPAGARHRLHRRPLPAGQGPHRALLANPARSPRQRAPPARASPPSRPPMPSSRPFSPISTAALPAPPPTPTAAWRPAPRDLAAVLSCRYTRRVARDNTVRLGPRWVQLPRRRSYAGRRVEVRECLDGRLLVFADGRCLAAQPAPAPAFVLRPRQPPSADSPPTAAVAPPRRATRGRRPPPAPRRAAPRAPPPLRPRTNPVPRTRGVTPRRTPSAPGDDILTEQLT